VKRIDVFYEGRLYTIGNRGLSDVQREIADGVRSGEPRWLKVNAGEGRYAETFLLITRATSISLSAVVIDEMPPPLTAPEPEGELHPGVGLDDPFGH